MTEKRARALHRAMWHWLAKHPKSSKSDWPGWRLRDKDVDVSYEYARNQCFACLITRSCFKCPITKKAGICNGSVDLWSRFKELCHKDVAPNEWAEVCNLMADAWREIKQ